MTVDGANTHDKKMTEHTLMSIIIERPRPTKAHPQNLCLDNGFDFHEVDELLAKRGYPAT